MKIKNKIRDWLFKDELEIIKSIRNETKTLYDNYEYIKPIVENSLKIFNEAKNEMNKSAKISDECRKTMNEICDIGVDIGFKDEYHNWAVICIHGRTEFVKFIQLGQNDIYSVAKFLKQFEYSKHRIDSPLGYKEMLDDLILKYK